jgi:7,8-dihydro-6-hydroxymethylpterin-pyrophosphokinase
LDRQVQEAMRRVDWDYVKTQSSQVAQETADLLTEFEAELNQRLRPARKEKSAQRTLDLDLHV